MPILNYTTQIEADKTIGEIQQCLVAHGANAVLCEYDDQGSIIALSFKIRIEEKDVGFRLPSDWRPVLQILERHAKVPRRLASKDQAIRVAWRILKDWVEAQMAIVEVKMVKMDQVFLPYAVTPSGDTMYEHIMKNRLLGSGD